MTQQTEKKIHWSFWTISVIALIWNLMGVANLSMQFIAPESLSFPEWWREVIANRPFWSTAAMVLALLCAVIGCVLLFLKRAEAVFLFIASLIGIVLTVSHAATVGDPGLRQIFEGVVLPVVLAVFLIWYAHYAIRKQWLR